jgi:hypothetical protein
MRNVHLSSDSGLTRFMPDIYSVRRLSVYDRCAFFNAGTCVSACGPTTCRENQSFGKTAKSDPENHRKDASQSRSNGRGRWALMFSEQTAEDHISISRTGTRGSSKYHFFRAITAHLEIGCRFANPRSGWRKGRGAPVCKPQLARRKETICRSKYHFDRLVRIPYFRRRERVSNHTDRIHPQK